jgi:hypothetical protein
MLLSQMLAVALSVSATQRDPVDTTRDAFNLCLRHIVDTGISTHKTTADIRSQVTAGCTTEEAAYRAAMIRSDVAVRILQAEAERNATTEIDASRDNARESIQDAQPH